jgi:MoaA/NifB/PqqE/SkfB family radical SAM enzyme
MTLRQSINHREPIKELKYPEFYDIKITNACGGRCPYCYQDSQITEGFDTGILGKFARIFGPMDMNQRPFQIAYGGGEPTLHPHFIDLLRETRRYGISPNYTTNGMHMTEELVKATKEYCDGVAVSCHRHQEHYWIRALMMLSNAGIKTNLHIMIDDEDSIARFCDIVYKYMSVVHKFILLPYVAVGRATPKKVECDLLFGALKQMGSISQIGFGAMFFEELKKHPWLDVSLYEPELMSKYIDLERMTVHPSSFHTDESMTVKEFFNGG